MYVFLAMLVFTAVMAFSLVVMSGGSSLVVYGFSLPWLLLLWSMGIRHAGFSSCGTWAQQLWLLGPRAQAQWLRPTRLSCFRARGIFLDQGSNTCFLHWQVDSLPMSHQGCPQDTFIHLKNLEESTELLYMWLNLLIFTHKN